MRKQKVYIGEIDPQKGPFVRVGECDGGADPSAGGLVLASLADLPPRLDVVNHSPTGYAWGYAGSGPSQLSFAILADLIGVSKAVAYYQAFKAKVVSQLNKDEAFILTQEQVFDQLRAIDGWVE